MGSANGCGLGEVNTRRATSLPDEPGGKNTAPQAMPLGIDARRKLPPRAQRRPQLAASAVNQPCPSAPSASESQATTNAFGAAIVPSIVVFAGDSCPFRSRVEGGGRWGTGPPSGRIAGRRS